MEIRKTAQLRKQQTGIQAWSVCIQSQSHLLLHATTIANVIVILWYKCCLLVIIFSLSIQPILLTTWSIIKKANIMAKIMPMQ